MKIIRSGSDLVIIGGLVLLSFLVAGLGQDRSSSVRANAPLDAAIYLPLVQKPPEPEVVNVVVTKRGGSIGYPSYAWAYGYVESLLPTQNLSITLGIEVTWLPYCDPSDPEPDCDPFTVIEALPTAFTVTVPNQINPFQYSLILGKASANLGEVHVLTATPASQDFHPITIVNWTRNAGVVEGTARNDTAYTLDTVRVVIGSDSCSWRETDLDATLLIPGQETSFSRSYPYCEGEALYVVGQGVALP